MAEWRIVVADDEPYVVLAIKEVLESLPAKVLDAHDGQAALTLVRAERPDLVLLDVKMPKLDGYQVAMALKKDPATADIPLIFFSALGAPSEKVRGLDLGAEDYLAKPIDAEELKARVRTVLRRRPSRSAPPPAPSPPAPEGPAVGGTLQSVNLSLLIRQMEAERRTTRVLLARGAERGELAVVDGHIAQAIQGSRRGDSAVFQLLTWQEGTFQLVSLDASQLGGGEVAAPNQGLLLEGSRRLEEIPGLRTRLATLKGFLRVAPRIQEAVRRLSAPLVASLVSLLDGTRELETVLAQSPFDTWMTLKTLQRLQGVGALECDAPAAAGDRRGGLRVKVGLSIEYQSLGLWQQSAIFNLSAWGVFIRTAVPFEIGEQVILRFQIPGQDHPVRAMGRVVWANTDPSKWGGMGMGIQFLDLAGVDREAIETHLAGLVAAQISGSGDQA
jgi:uncharacterized protein (TIGR02266 family)